MTREQFAAAFIKRLRRLTDDKAIQDQIDNTASVLLKAGWKAREVGEFFRAIARSVLGEPKTLLGWYDHRAALVEKPQSNDAFMKLLAKGDRLANGGK